MASLEADNQKVIEFEDVDVEEQKVNEFVAAHAPKVIQRMPQLEAALPWIKVTELHCKEVCTAQLSFSLYEWRLLLRTTSEDETSKLLHWLQETVRMGHEVWQSGKYIGLKLADIHGWH